MGTALTAAGRQRLPSRAFAARAHLDRETQTYRRLRLMREFLVFVGDEMEGIAERWLAHRSALDEELGGTSR